MLIVITMNDFFTIKRKNRGRENPLDIKYFIHHHHKRRNENVCISMNLNIMRQDNLINQNFIQVVLSVPSMADQF